MQAGGVNSSLVPAVHTSDVLRLLLLFRFGGFYHDLDYVVLGHLSQYTNSVLEEKGYGKILEYISDHYQFFPKQTEDKISDKNS